MDDLFFILEGGPPTSKMQDAHWWFLLSPLQKRQHLYVDSNIEDIHINLILRIYGETEKSLEIEGV